MHQVLHPTPHSTRADQAARTKQSSASASHTGTCLGGRTCRTDGHTKGFHRSTHHWRDGKGSGEGQGRHPMWVNAIAKQLEPKKKRRRHQVATWTQAGRRWEATSCLLYSTHADAASVLVPQCTATSQVDCCRLQTVTVGMHHIYVSVLRHHQLVAAAAGTDGMSGPLPTHSRRVRYQRTAVKNRAAVKNRVEAAVLRRHQATACGRVRCGLACIYALSPHRHTRKRCCNQHRATWPDQPAKQGRHTPNHSTFLHPCQTVACTCSPLESKHIRCRKACAVHAGTTQKEQTAMWLLRDSTQSSTHCQARQDTLLCNHPGCMQTALQRSKKGSAACQLDAHATQKSADASRQTPRGATAAAATRPATQAHHSRQSACASRMSQYPSATRTQASQRQCRGQPNPPGTRSW